MRSNLTIYTIYYLTFNLFIMLLKYLFFTLIGIVVSIVFHTCYHHPRVFRVVLCINAIYIVFISLWLLIF